MQALFWWALHAYPACPLPHCPQEGDLDKLVRGRQGALLSEDKVMLKFVQLCLALQHVHGKVRPGRGQERGLGWVQCGGRGTRHAQPTCCEL